MEPSAPVAEPPSSPTTVMDVVPPPAAEPENVSEESTDFKSVADSATEPPAETVSKKTPAVKKDKSKTSGVAIAIVATVVIVIALAAMATYAYIKTK